MDTMFTNAGAQARSDSQLERWLRERYSCRAFLPDPVPRSVIERILELAQRTASWCNCQPWQLVITEGAATERVRRALTARAEAGLPTTAPEFPFPSAYKKEYMSRRREAGFQLYRAVGVARGDRPAYRRQEMRNFLLFDAPHLALITSPADLGEYGAIDCGGYVSTFLLAARANGVATVPQAALAMYPDVLREQLDLPGDRRVVCGISFGYENPDHAANSYRTHRAELEDVARFVSE